MTENEDQTGVDLDSTPTPAQDAANSGVGKHSPALLLANP